MSTAASILTHLNQAQRQAVQADGGPILVLAGAGSGKTRVLTHRVAYLIAEKDIKAEQILAVTFTNKAAGEMKTRVSKLLQIPNPRFQIPDSKFQTPTICTFHSFCARVLRRHGSIVGLAPSFLIFDENDQLALFKKVMTDLEISTKRFSPRSLLATISAAKNELIDPVTYQNLAQSHYTEIVAQLYPPYQNSLRASHAVDFDDLLVLTVQLFQKDPEILESHQDRFRFILIDEYQDTNRAQYVLTKLLAEKNRDLFVVGDAAQSIYSFRGADFRNIYALQKDFPEIKIYHLQRNYRSTKNILTAANTVISHNTSHPILKLYTQNQTGELIKLYRAADETDEAGFVAETIWKNYLRDPKVLTDFAVLYRTNAQSRTFEESFLQLGLPYVLVGGVKFYERKEIKDVLAYLRLFYNPNDQVSWGRAVKLGRRRLENFEKWVKKTRSLPLATLPSTRQLLDQILKATNYLSQFNPEDESDLARLENIKELRSVAAAFPDLDRFLENVALVQLENRSDEPESWKDNAVTLLTVHAAKGLEFKTVFMVGMEENLFPHSRSLFDKLGLEEERRLAYVGMTRAKENLIFTCARRRLYLGAVNRNQVSRFVEAVSKELIDELF